MRTTLWALTALLAFQVAACGSGDGITMHQQVVTTGLPDSREIVFFSGEKAGRDTAQMRVLVDAGTATGTMTVANKNAKTVSVVPLDTLRRDAGDVTLQDTGRTEKIAGHEAHEYTIAGGGMVGSVWLADGFAIPPTTREWALRAGVLSAKVPATTLTEAVVKAKGLPLRSAVTLTVGSATLEVKTEVTSVLPGIVPADLASVPAGFAPAGTTSPGDKP